MLANGTRFPRPCSLSESFLSTGDSITMELRISDSTALRLTIYFIMLTVYDANYYFRPVQFRALYEFVDLHLDGEPYPGGPCNRKFSTITEDTQPKFQAPRDIFLYGRGGAKKLRYSFYNRKFNFNN